MVVADALVLGVVLAVGKSHTKVWRLSISSSTNTGNCLILCRAIGPSTCSVLSPLTAAAVQGFRQGSLQGILKEAKFSKVLPAMTGSR